MSYTLRGRLESRLGASLLPVLVAFLLAAVLPAWWPVLLAALMLGVGLTLDGFLYNTMDYQPGWYALPLGLLELGVLVGLMRALEIHAPLPGALAFYAGAWLAAQALAHAGFPLLRLSYAEEGGELGQVGAATLALVVAGLGSAGGIYWAKLPPTVHLAAGVHQGPLVLDHPQTLVGEPGAIVRGGIIVRASHVIVRDVTVEGGLNGIEVDEARHVKLERVHVLGAKLDGIHVRRSQVTIEDCTVLSTGDFVQGIDISFAVDRGMSHVRGCDVRGGYEGIVTHSSMVLVEGNIVRGTTLRAIDMTEMSMGEIRKNDVRGAIGVGIFCGDSSECGIERNVVTGTRPDLASGDLTRAGVAIEAHRDATATLDGNKVTRNPRPVAAFVNASIEHPG